MLTVAKYVNLRTVFVGSVKNEIARSHVVGCGSP